MTSFEKNPYVLCLIFDILVCFSAMQILCKDCTSQSRIFLFYLIMKKKENAYNKLRGEINIWFFVSLRMQMAPPYWVVGWLIDRYQQVVWPSVEQRHMASTQTQTQLKLNSTQLNSSSTQLKLRMWFSFSLNRVCTESLKISTLLEFFERSLDMQIRLSLRITI